MSLPLAGLVGLPKQEFWTKIKVDTAIWKMIHVFILLSDCKMLT